MWCVGLEVCCAGSNIPGCSPVAMIPGESYGFVTGRATDGRLFGSLSEFGDPDVDSVCCVIGCLCYIL